MRKGVRMRTGHLEEALQSVLEAEANLDSVYPFKYFLHFDDERLAGFAALVLQEAGYQTETVLSIHGGWTVIVCAYHRHDPYELERRVEFLENIAEAYGGEYDGWDMPVER